MIANLDFIGAAAFHHLSREFVDGMIAGGLIVCGIVGLGIAFMLARTVCAALAEKLPDDVDLQDQSGGDCIVCQTQDCAHCPLRTTTEVKP